MSLKYTPDHEWLKIDGNQATKLLARIFHRQKRRTAFRHWATVKITMIFRKLALRLA